MEPNDKRIIEKAEATSFLNASEGSEMVINLDKWTIHEVFRFASVASY